MDAEATKPPATASGRRPGPSSAPRGRGPAPRVAVRACFPSRPQAPGAEASFVLSPLPPPAPKALLPGGDMETAWAWRSSTRSWPTRPRRGRTGSPTRALHVAGTLGANATVLLRRPPAPRTVGLRPGEFSHQGLSGRHSQGHQLGSFGTGPRPFPRASSFGLVSEWHGDASFARRDRAFLYAATPGSDSGGSWVRASLDITATDTARPLLLRLGSGTYDFWIDELVMSPEGEGRGGPSFSLGRGPGILRRVFQRGDAS
jgi:hypothetical protein